MISWRRRRASALLVAAALAVLPTTSAGTDFKKPPAAETADAGFSVTGWYRGVDDRWKPAVWVGAAFGLSALLAAFGLSRRHNRHDDGSDGWSPWDSCDGGGDD